MLMIMKNLIFIKDFISLIFAEKFRSFDDDDENFRKRLIFN